jgi:hypothetical protein
LTEFAVRLRAGIHDRRHQASRTSPRCPENQAR